MSRHIAAWCVAASSVAWMACGAPHPSPAAVADAKADLHAGDVADSIAAPSWVPLANAWTEEREGWRLAVDGDAGLVRAFKAGESQPRAVLDLRSWRVAQVPAFDPQYNYNPSHLGSHPPDALTWSAVTAVQHVQLSHPIAEIDADTSVMRLETAGGAGPAYWLAVRAEAGIGWRFELRPLDDAAAQQWAADKGEQPVVFVQIAALAPAAEGYYGIGEMMDTPQHRGKVRALQLEGDFGLDGSSNEGHVRLPLLVGTRGWGLFAQTYRAGVFDVAATDKDRILGQFSGHALTLHLLLADTALDVPGRYWKLTGVPALPAPWALGGLLWRNENKDQAEVLQDAADLRKHDLALSGMWVDRPYDVAVNDFGFKPSQFPDPKTMVAQLHAQGLRLGLWSTPYFDPGYGGKPKSQHHDEAKSKGYYVQGANMWAQLMKWGPPIDFTRPEADAFFRNLVQQYTAMQIEGFKLDYGEDIVLGLQQVRIGWQFADGSDERTMHHAFQLGYHAAYADQLPKRDGMAGGGWILARSSTWGDQVKTSMIWPGDLCAGWVRHGECTADGECHAGGLPASVAAAISLPTAGFPLFGADTGGYRHGRAPKELFLRWLQHTALTGVLQIGGGTDHNPWLVQPPDNELTSGAPFDAETLEVARALIRLHARLFPLLWTELSRTQGGEPKGVGPVRALGLQYPQFSGDAGLRANEADQWMLGDDLLVAPVVTPALARAFWLPPGVWVNWSTGEVVDGGSGGKLLQREVPLTEVPMWVKAGAIVPLLRPDIDTLAPAQDPAIQSFSTRPGLLWLRVALAATPTLDSQRTLWDGTQLSVQQQGASLILTAAASPDAKARVFSEGAVWQLEGVDTLPQSVSTAAGALPAVADPDAVSGCPAGCWHYDAGGQRLTVRRPAWGSLQIKR